MSKPKTKPKRPQKARTTSVKKPSRPKRVITLVDGLKPVFQEINMLAADKRFLLTDEARDQKRISRCDPCKHPCCEASTDFTPESFLLALEETGEYSAYAEMTTQRPIVLAPSTSLVQ